MKLLTIVICATLLSVLGTNTSAQILATDGNYTEIAVNDTTKARIVDFAYKRQLLNYDEKELLHGNLELVKFAHSNDSAEGTFLFDYNAFADYIVEHGIYSRERATKVVQKIYKKVNDDPTFLKVVAVILKSQEQ